MSIDNNNDYVPPADYERIPVADLLKKYFQLKDEFMKKYGAFFVK